MVVAERLIHLHGCELGVVAAVDAFVAEVAIDFVNLGQATHDQLLEIQLGGNPQKERHPQRVVVGGKWTRGRPPRDRMHHGCFNFQETTCIHAATDGRNDLTAGGERLQNFRVGKQINVAPTGPEFWVLQAMPFFWRGLETLAGQLEAVGPDTNLALPRSSHAAPGHDDIAVIQFPCQPERVCFQVALGTTDLKIACGITDDQESQLAHLAVLDTPSRHQNLGPRIFNGLFGVLGRPPSIVGSLIKHRPSLGERDQPIDPLSVSIDLKFVTPAAQLVEAGFEQFIWLWGCFRHRG